MTIDLHDLTLPTLPEWGPDVPGTPVAVRYPQGNPQGNILLAHAWADSYTVLSVDAGACFGFTPNPWDQVRITAVLADDPTRWPAVDADERVELGEHLVGARACGERDGETTVAGPVKEVDDDGWLWTKGWQLLAAPHYPLRVHPADLAAAREAATPKPPTCWDDWEAGDVWVWNGAVYRMGDDRVLRLATRGRGWVPATLQPGGSFPTVAFSPLTDVDLALVAAADEAARLPDEPPVGSFALDRNGSEWFRTVDGWVRARSGWNWEWAELNERSGPVTVIHRAAS